VEEVGAQATVFSGCHSKLVELALLEADSEMYLEETACEGWEAEALSLIISNVDIEVSVFTPDFLLTTTPNSEGG
jgi:hypothetical protein